MHTLDLFRVAGVMARNLAGYLTHVNDNNAGMCSVEILFIIPPTHPPPPHQTHGPNYCTHSPNP